MSRSSTRLIIVTAAMVSFTTLAACSKGASQRPLEPQAPSQKTETEPKEVTTVTLAEKTTWTLQTPSSRFLIHNLGWEECMGSTCVLHDYSKISADGKTGYVYRTLKVIEANDLSGIFTTSLKLSPADGDSGVFTTSATEWEKASERIQSLIDAQKTSWSWDNQVDFARTKNALEKETSEMLRRCKSSASYSELIRRPVEQFGNLLLSSRYLFFLDRHTENFVTTLEFDWGTESLISLATMRFQAAKELYRSKFYNRPETEFFAIAALGNTALFVEGLKPLDLYKPAAFEFNCDGAYATIAPRYSDIFDERYDQRASAAVDEKMQTAPFRRLPDELFYFTAAKPLPSLPAE